MKPTLAILAASLTLAGCTNVLLSDERVRDDTATALHQPISAVIVRDWRYDGLLNTYYEAETPQGTYDCVINGGSVLVLGPAAPPRCSR